MLTYRNQKNIQGDQENIQDNTNMRQNIINCLGKTVTIISQCKKYQAFECLLNIFAGKYTLDNLKSETKM